MSGPDSLTPGNAAAAILADRGWANFNQPPQPVEFTDLPQANALLNDLAGHPHAFVLACLCDRQDSAVRVWRIPYLLGERIGSVEFEDLASLSASEIALAMSSPEPLHRYSGTMADVVYRGLQRIAEQYAGDASTLWAGNPPSAALILGFLGFYGAGVKIASMASNILVRELKVPVSDKYSLDVSPDAHVRRVFTRIGLITDGASEEEIMYSARAVSPEYPGVLDLGAWEVGRQWCRPTGPKCGECTLRHGCPTAAAAS
jgi:endonuclease-3